MVADGMATEEDLALLQVVDTPEEAVQIIVDATADNTRLLARERAALIERIKAESAAAEIAPPQL